MNTNSEETNSGKDQDSGKNIATEKVEDKPEVKVVNVTENSRI